MKKLLRRYSVILFWAIIIILSALYFTNDFGIVDINKSSIIAAVGIDCTENEVQVTAQVAVPKPSQEGGEAEYTQVQGSGETVADALNEINAKTGYYPKLQFCKLILIGEECQKEDLFRLLGCFYRKNYSELTALVAMCAGKASELFALPTPTKEMSSMAVQQVLSDELKKSANVSAVNLKEIALTNFSQSSACYMPYVEPHIQGTSEEGGNGDDVGGKPPETGQNGSSGSSGGGQSGSSGGSESGSSGGSEGSSGGGGQKPVGYTARRTAIFSGGKFKGILTERQSFALDILKNDIRLAVLPCDADGTHYTLGLKNTEGSLKVSVKDDALEVTMKFSGSAQIAGKKQPVDPKETANDDLLPPEVKEGARAEIENRFKELFETCREVDCDVLELKTLLFKYDYKNYDKFKDNILKSAKLKLEVEIGSVN